MPTQKEIEYQMINDFAGQLQDAAYSLLALPAASRFDRFMIVHDLSFFCDFERGKTISETEFHDFTKTMMQPFIVSDWVKSFEFYDEKKVAEAEAKGKNELPQLPRFDTFVAQFSHNWYRIFKAIENIVEEHRPTQKLSMIRARDTELSVEAMNQIGTAMQVPIIQQLVTTALPTEWQVMQRLQNRDQPKFVLYRRDFKIWGADQAAVAYIMVYLPSRMMKGLPELRQTFA